MSTENVTMEYVLKIGFPELGSEDVMTVSVDLDSKPGLDSIIGNFYRFLSRIGIDPDIIDNYIQIPGEEDYDYDYEEDSQHWEDAAEKIVTDIENSILENSTDENKKKEFMHKMKESPEFAEEVFRVFLSSILKDEEQ